MDINQLPIDIHLSKLLDWIIDRRQCSRDWQKNVLPIRNRINLAIQDMPEHDEITNLLSGSSIHYFNCLKIVEILKETEKNSKNIFGMYSSQRMKDWNSIVSSYQKNNIYLAEAASILQRNVAYEIPALKKLISKCEQQQIECEVKQTSLGKSINEINLQIRQYCNELDIPGLNVSKELKTLPQQSVQIFSEITNKTSKLDKAVEFYKNYVEYFFQRNQNDSLSVLSYLIQKGNTTVYEWRTGSEPKQIERPTDLIVNFGDEEEEENKKEGVNDEINYDLGDLKIEESNQPSQDQNEEIDWGDIDLNIDSTGVDTNVIDYDIDSFKNEISVEEAGVYIPTDNIAKGNDALSLLEFPETRNMFLNDIFRLVTFLKQKLGEMKSESDNLIISTILQDMPKIIQSATERDLKRFIDQTIDVINYFKWKKVEQLIRINDSPNYLKRLYDQYLLKKKSIERCNRNQTQQEIKLKELSVEENELKEKLKLLIKKTKELQKFFCEDLSKKYNGVRINLMGEINLL